MSTTPQPAPWYHVIPAATIAGMALLPSGMMLLTLDNGRTFLGRQGMDDHKTLLWVEVAPVPGSRVAVEEARRNADPSEKRYADASADLRTAAVHFVEQRLGSDVDELLDEGLRVAARNYVAALRGLPPLVTPK